MGKYKGFTCDSCGKVVDASTRTKKRTSFEGPVIDGAFTEDLCPECAVVPEGVNFKETKRRGPRPNGQVDGSDLSAGEGTAPPDYANAAAATT